MFSKFANFVTEKRWYVVALWIIAAAVIVTFSPKLSDETSNDQASFLPSKYESVQAQDIAKASFPQSQGESATILFKNSSGGKLTASDQQTIAKVVGQLNKANIDKVTGVLTSPQLISKNGKIQLAQAQLNGNPQDQKLLDSVATLRDKLSDNTKHTDLTYAVTGTAAISLDTEKSSGNAELIVGIVTLLLILILPIIIFRSPLAAFLPLLSVGIVYTMANSLLALSAKVFNFEVSGQLTSLLIVILFGIGTDYVLFLLFRYRERLRTGDHTRGAVSFALTRAGEAIVSAALVVGAAFAALFSASLGFFTSLAPGLVISVALMLIASMTLVPALLAIVGDKVFWPSKKWQKKQTNTIATKLGKAVSHHPGRFATLVVVVLIVLATGVFQYKASFDLTSQLPSNTESTKAFKDLTAAFPAGTGSPTLIYIKSNHTLSQASLTAVTTKVSAAHGVASVLPAQLSADGKAAIITVTLADDPTSDKAIDAVAGPIRDAAHSTGLDAQIAVGGETASYADLKAATNHDIATIVPFAAILIFIILAIVLRSLVAPLYLLLSVGLGVLATLGTASYLFITIGGNTGMIFMLPILLYIFVVAAGTDYNILMITRLREEVHTEGNHPKLAAENAIKHTAATLVATGIILAGTFASLSFAGLSLLTQMGFSVSFGIAIGAFVISLILIPSISTLLGKSIWWPGHGNSSKTK